MSLELSDGTFKPQPAAWYESCSMLNSPLSVRSALGTRALYLASSKLKTQLPSSMERNETGKPLVTQSQFSEDFAGSRETYWTKYQGPFQTNNQVRNVANWKQKVDSSQETSHQILAWNICKVNQVLLILEMRSPSPAGTQTRPAWPWTLAFSDLEKGNSTHQGELQIDTLNSHMARISFNLLEAGPANLRIRNAEMN